MKKVLSTLCAIGAVVAFFLLLGSAGALETNCISFSTGAKNMILYAGIFGLCVICGLVLSKKGDN